MARQAVKGRRPVAQPRKGETKLADAARRLRVAYDVAYRLLLSGALKGRRAGTRWFVDQADLERVRRERAAIQRARARHLFQDAEPPAAQTR